MKFSYCRALVRVFALLALALAGTIQSSAKFAAVNSINYADTIEANKLMTNLATATTAQDSMTILNDLFDLSFRQGRTAIGEAVVNLALKTGNSAVGLDMVRNLTNVHTSSDSLLLLDREMALKFPASDDRDETVCLVEMMRNNYRSRYSILEERQDQLRTLLVQVETAPDNVYDHIVFLHALCLNLSGLSREHMLPKYINKLDSLINTIRPEAYSLRNCFYVQASMAFGKNYEESAAGLKYDRKLLACIDSLECGATGVKRKYRNYDSNRYVVYTRMLSNYPNLSVEETKDIYGRIMDIVKNDTVAAQTMRLSLRPQVYYAAKMKDYATLLPLVDRALQLPSNKLLRNQLLRIKIEAAKALGDKEALLSALLEYTDELQRVMEQRSADNWRELQVLYDVASVKNRYESEKRSGQRIMLVGAVTAAIILLILLVVMMILFRHANRLTKNLRLSNQKLIAESETLKTTRKELEGLRSKEQLTNRLNIAFVKNLTDEVSGPLKTINEYTDLILDCSDVSVKNYLKRYADMVSLNSEIVSVIINDLKMLINIDNGNFSLSPRRESLKYICEMAIEGVKPRVHESVNIEIAPDSQDVEINTDIHKVLQVMWQLLSNAAKFTQMGSIVVSCRVDDSGKNAIIRVKDTGIGIAKANAERIFERFVKLDSKVPGAGIGLPLARLIADMLSGSVTLVSSDSGGSTFEFKFPLVFRHTSSTK